MKHILLIGTAMFLISPITLYAGVTVDLNTNTETGIMNGAQQQQTVKGIVKGLSGKLRNTSKNAGEKHKDTGFATYLGLQMWLFRGMIKRVKK